jgi:homoserine kinase
MKRPFTVKVPASSGNLGAGFDVLGLSLKLHSELRVQILSPKPGKPMIRVHGEGETSVPRDGRNLLYQCIAFVFKKAKRPVPRLELFCLNRIPLARGLGSSSAAIVAGLVAGNHLLGDKFSKQQLVAWATELEGHADNVASAFLGGIQGNLVVGKTVISRSWPVPNLKCVVAVPAFELSTKKARAVLPKAVPLQDAVANIAAVAMLGTLSVLGGVESALANEVKVATVDMQKALQSVDAGKKAKSQLEREFNDKKKKLQDEEASIKKLGEEFKKQAAVLNDETRMRRQAEIQERIVKFQELTPRSTGRSSTNPSRSPIIAPPQAHRPRQSNLRRAAIRPSNVRSP